MSTDPVFSEIQKINPSAIIELFVLQLDTALHGTNNGFPVSNNESNIFRFHAGTNLNANGEIIWANKKYARFPIEASGFAYKRGKSPRPKVSISNKTGFMSAILNSVNQVTAGNDLTGASFTRIKTMARFIDHANFPSTVTTTSTTLDTSDVETVTFTVTVAQDYSGVNIFLINGTQNPVIIMKRNSTYIFNQSHSSNAGHPLRIKSNASGQQTTVNAGTLGVDATVTYTPSYPNAPNDLRYYCTVHGNAMGNTITMNDPNTIQTTTTSSVTPTNPFGTPDPTAEFKRQIFIVDRKASENREVVEFELAASTDMAGVRAPKRQCTRALFPSIGTFNQ